MSRLLRTLRHLLSILALPFMVVVVVPGLILGFGSPLDTRWPSIEPLTWAGRVAGGSLFLIGLGLFGWCVSLFARVGRGTLAPWDPTQRLVAEGPYRHVRNPMISAVALMLAGEALLWGSALGAGWCVAFVAANHVYFIRLEEPGLAQRFGDEYLAYRSRVPRWLPTVRPWDGA